MKNLKKRGCAWFLAVLMTVSLFSSAGLQAYAAEEETTASETVQEEVAEETAEKLDSEAVETEEETAQEEVQEEEISMISLQETQVEELTLDSQELTLQPEETVALTVTVSPADAEDVVIEWASEDNSVAMVDETGVITGLNYGSTTVTATVEGQDISASCTVYVGFPVYFYPDQIKAENFSLTVSYQTREKEGITLTSCTDEEGAEGYLVCLPAGDYSYTAKADGYYGSTCGFTVSSSGTVAFVSSLTSTIQSTYGLTKMIDTANATFYPSLEVFTPSSNEGAWDGTTIDVSWFDPEGTTFYISTPEELAGMAAIVNGIYNDEITTIIDSDGSYTPEEYSRKQDAKIVAGNSSGSSASNNMVSSSDYYYNAKGYDFDGQTVYLTADLDMGGYTGSDGEWTGARYMPIGGQYQMYYVVNGVADGYSHLGSSFNGTFDGNGHIVYNIYCDRYSVTAYGDSVSVGLIGRLGNHDNDYTSWAASGDDGGNYPAVNPTVRNVAVAGYIYGRRSIGGIVGKIGQTSASILGDGSTGGIIENCVNFATVKNTDAKGCGGIVGAGWNSGLIQNCVNFGTISSTYNNPTGGISGSNEVPIINCYNVGAISAKKDSYAMGIGTKNGGDANAITNCYWLTGMSPGGGYYNAGSSATVTECTAEEMQASTFADLLNGSNSRNWTYAKSSDAIYTFLEEIDGGTDYTVPRAFTEETGTCLGIRWVEVPEDLTFVQKAFLDLSGLEVYADWAEEDGTTSSELLTTFTCTLDGEPFSQNGELAVDPGYYELIVTATVGEVTDSRSIGITVTTLGVESMKLSTNPSKKKYNEEDSYDPSGGKITIVFTNGRSVTVVWIADEDGNGGVWANQYDYSDTYDITIANPDGTLFTEQTLTTAVNDGNPMTFTYTDLLGQVFTVTTSSLTVYSAENRPQTDEDGFYLVGTTEELDWVAGQVNNQMDLAINFRLTADVTASENLIIGTNSYPYAGVFDGDGHTITLQINNPSLSSSTDRCGLFGATDEATIQNVVTAGSVVGVARITGALVGFAQDTLIQNCGNEADISVDSSVTSGSTYYGGLVGDAYNNVTIVNCYNKGNIDTTNISASTGGIVGYVYKGTSVIQNCYNWGDITNTSSSTSYAGTGGIVGRIAQSGSTIENLYNAGQISNTSTTFAKYVGALVGYATYECCTNYYYLEGTASYSIGNSVLSTTGAVDSETLVAAYADDVLGTAFVYNEGDGLYPLLSWEADATSQTAVLSMTAVITEEAVLASAGSAVATEVSADASVQTIRNGDTPAYWVTSADGSVAEGTDTLQEAVALCTDSGTEYTIEMIAESETITECVVVAYGATVTITTAGESCPYAYQGAGSAGTLYLGSSGNSVLQLSHANVTLQNITIDNGISGTSMEKPYLYLLCSDDILNLEEGCTIQNYYSTSTDSSASAIYCYQGTLHVNGATIRKNTIDAKTGMGGAIYATASSTVNIDGGTISENTAGLGGAIYSKATLNLYDGSITENTASYGAGGAIYFAGTMAVYGGTISDNSTASKGGAISSNSTDTLYLYGGTVTGNKATSYGGGIYVGNVYLYGGTITGNTSESGSIGAGGVHVYTMLYLGSSSDATIEQMPIVITENTQTNGTVLDVYESKATKLVLCSELATGSEIGIATTVYTTSYNIVDAQFGTAEVTDADLSPFFCDLDDTLTAAYDGTNLIWAMPATFVVTFDGNGAEGTVPESIEGTEGSTVQLPEAGELTYENAIFIGWSTTETELIDKDGSEPDDLLEANADYTLGSEDVTFYAVWAEDSNENGVADYLEEQYTITYDANGAEGTVADAVKDLTGATVTLAEQGELTYENAIFVGWSTTATELIDKDGSEPDDLLTAGSEYTIGSEDTTLYAVWAEDSNDNGVADYLEEQYTITYDANGAEGTVADAVKDLTGATVTLAEQGELTYENAIFVGWSTTATELIDKDGSEPDDLLTAGSEYTIGSEDTTLYAVWAEDSNDNGVADYLEEQYTITYDANGAEGTVSDAVKELTGETLTLAGQGELTYENAVFLGWTTTATELIDQDGSMPEGLLTEGSEYTVEGEDVTLYAVWATDSNGDGTADFLEDKYTVTYEKNGAQGTAPAIAANRTGEILTLAEQGDMTYEGAIFVGWSTTATELIDKDGSVPADLLTAGSDYTMGSEDVILYAVWAEDSNENGVADYLEEQYTITYDANGAEGTVADALQDLVGDTVTLPGQGELTYENAIFVGWSTTATELIDRDGSEPTDLLTAGSEYTMGSEDTTLYAVWAEDANGNGVADYLEEQYTITYDANGAEGSVSDVLQALTGETITLPGQGELTYDDAVFVGWSTTATGVLQEGDSAPEDLLKEGSAYTVGNGNVTLYAVWADSNWKEQTTITVEYYLENLEDEAFTLDTTTSMDCTIGDLLSALTLEKAYEGFTLNAELTTADGEAVADSTVITDNMVVRFYYRRNVYTVTYEGNGNDQGPTEVVEELAYKYGAKIEVKSAEELGMAYTGHTFLYWEGSIINSGDTWIVTADKTLVAQWSVDVGVVTAEVTTTTRTIRTGDTADSMLLYLLLGAGLTAVLAGYRRKENRA